MNQDFTVQKKQYLSEKKFVQRCSPEKKIPAQAMSEKKFVQAENSLPPPHHFSNGPSLITTASFHHPFSPSLVLSARCCCLKKLEKRVNQ